MGHDGRTEIVDAVRSLPAQEARADTGPSELAARVTDEMIAGHLYCAGEPDPQLLIRTCGERRLSWFLLWQAVAAELYFCDTCWPGWLRLDLLYARCTYDRRTGRGRRSTDGR